MIEFSSLSEQFRSIRKSVIFILFAAASIIGIVLLLHFWRDVPFSKLTRDPSQILKGPFYTGFLSQAGIFFWAAAAAICFFCYRIIQNSINKNNLKMFFLASGLITLMLGLDDVFLLHEEFFPNLGISENLVYGVYLGILLGYLFKYFRIILKTDFNLLIAAFFFFGLSVILDVIETESFNPYFFEDSFKFTGIVIWLTYYFHTGISVLKFEPQIILKNESKFNKENKLKFKKNNELNKKQNGKR